MKVASGLEPQEQTEAALSNAGSLCVALLIGVICGYIGGITALIVWALR